MTAHTSNDSQSSHDLAHAAADELHARAGSRHDIAVVLGSGWSGAANALGETVMECKTEELPGFRPSAVAGHQGTIRSIAVKDSSARALVFGTRTHYYEGHGTDAVAHPIRVAAAAGCTTVVLTNGCGSLVPAWVPGTTVLIRDHINLTGATPLRGATFVDLTDLYSSRLRAIAQDVAGDLPEGVYVQFPGPQYETPAEVKMAGILGGDLVGMSTTLEAIAAREAGMEVMGISLVTNAAAGMGEGSLDHSEVIQAGKESADRIGPMLAQIVQAIVQF